MDLKTYKKGIIYKFNKLHWNMAKIGREYNVSRQRIHQALKEWGVDTSYHQKLTILCDNPRCGAVIQKYRSEIERSKNHFCSPKCRGEFGRKNYGKETGA